MNAILCAKSAWPMKSVLKKLWTIVTAQEVILKDKTFETNKIHYSIKFKRRPLKAPPANTQT